MQQKVQHWYRQVPHWQQLSNNTIHTFLLSAYMQHYSYVRFEAFTESKWTKIIWGNQSNQSWVNNKCYNKNYQQMRRFVICLYFLFLVFPLHVSGFHGPIIRGITSCCFYATIWFLCLLNQMAAIVLCSLRLVLLYSYKFLACFAWMMRQTINKALHEPNGSIKTTACNTPDDGPMKARNM